MPNPPESDPTKVPDGNPHIAQDVDGDGNQVIGQAINSTIIGQANIQLPVHKPTGIPQNLPRSGVVAFVGRDQKLIDLHTQLQQNDRLAITAIAGMGGIGKTELALQYAIAQKGEYPAGLCWLRARDQEIATQIVSFAKTKLLLTIPDNFEVNEQVDLIWQRWPEGDALVVLDDVRDYKAIQPYLPPPEPRFKLLITTRLKLGSSLRDFPVEELDEESAITLLKSLAGHDRIQSQVDDAKALCQRVGCLPLGLELLGRYLASDLDLSVKELLKEWESMRLSAEALSVTEAGMTAKQGVLAALELSWKDLAEADQDLACMLGLFAITPISWEIVEQCFPEINSKQLKKTRNNGLLARSLLKRVGEKTYQLHQIVQEYFRIKLELRPDQGASLKKVFCKVILELFQNLDEKPIIEQIQGVSKAVPHLEEIARQWVNFVSDDDLGLIFSGIGRFYEGQGNYSNSEHWRKSCLELTRKRLGEEHLNVALSLYNLAELYRLQGRYKEAETIFQKTLEMRKRLLGDEHLDVATTLDTIALLYSDQKRNQEAEVLCKQALKIRKRILGDEHLDIATSLNNLALIYRHQGLFKEAELLFLQALRQWEKLFGKEHPHIATCLNNLADILRNQGKFDEAESLFKQALEQWKKLLGEDHLDVSYSLNNLALLYLNQARYEEAEPLLKQAIVTRKKFLGEEHPLIANSLRSLSEVHRSRGQYEEAESLLIQAKEIIKKLLGDESPDFAGCLHNLAGLYLSQERYEEAEALFQQALSLWEKLFGDKHPNLAITSGSLGSLYQKQNKLKDAELLYRKSYTILEMSLGQNHPQTKKIFAMLESLS